MSQLSPSHMGVASTSAWDCVSSAKPKCSGDTMLPMKCLENSEVLKSMGLFITLCGPRCSEKRQTKELGGNKALPVLEGVGTLREAIEKE